MYKPNAHVTSSHINKRRRAIDKLNARLDKRKARLARLILISNIAFYSAIAVVIGAMLYLTYINW